MHGNRVREGPSFTQRSTCALRFAFSALAIKTSRINEADLRLGV
jgi:hypothetical protein